MLKINLRDTPAEERWILHGRLTAPWVRELRASCRKNHRTEQVRPCIIDLNEVTFIDNGPCGCVAFSDPWTGEKRVVEVEV
jgi:anti-anti-sigma regulatory factor